MARSVSGSLPSFEEARHYLGDKPLFVKTATYNNLGVAQGPFKEIKTLSFL
jgi:hypothetical protein